MNVDFQNKEIDDKIVCKILSMQRVNKGISGSYGDTAVQDQAIPDLSATTGVIVDS